MRDISLEPGTWVGQHVPVAQACRIVVTALYEPYLVVKNGILQTVDSRE
jgi:hypothetical protein